MLALTSILLVSVFVAISGNRNTSTKYNIMDPATDQIVLFKEKHMGPVGMLTTSSGAPVSYTDATNTLNTNIFNNEYFFEVLSHLDRERVPERVVHAKGTGAFGYFEVTHDIRNICKAEMFSQLGKKTPVAVRFSTVTGERGSNELDREVRGYAVKFYTQEGIFDIVGINVPVFFSKDPIKFSSFVHASKRNPSTNLRDPNALWDFLTLNPEAIYQQLFLFGDRGLPASYVHMPGYGVHTYQVENEDGTPYFVRFHFTPDAGIKNLTPEEAEKIGAKDPDYYTRILYRDIANGKFPIWTVSIQLLTLEDVKKSRFEVFDLTKDLSLKKYPLIKVGKLILDRNPKNFFAEIEQLAFCPGNLIPGILGDPGKIFEARRFSYKDTQYYRLGANFNKITVNCPYRTKTLTYNRDGGPPVKDNEEGTPNYYPNSFNGPVPYSSIHKSQLIRIVEKPEPSNFEQASEFYSELTRDARSRLAFNIASSLNLSTPMTQKKAVAIFEEIHLDLGHQVAQALKAN